MRAMVAGDGCEVLFTARRRPGMTDADVDAECRGGDRRPRSPQGGPRSDRRLTAALNRAQVKRVFAPTSRRVPISTAGVPGLKCASG